MSELLSEKWIELVKLACYDAGKAIMDIYDTADFGVEMKSNDSPLTLADKAGHEAIMRQLEQTPYPVLSEEGRDIPYDQRKSWERFWMVDPLDGTKEFIKRNGEFTVNIALIENGRPIFGAVYVPVTDELYVGGEGMPAQWTQRDTTRQISPKQKASLNALLDRQGLRVVASRSHLNEATEQFVASLQAPELVSMGSSLKFLALASGRADVYPRYAPTMEWDTAAAHAVISSLGFSVVQEGTDKPLEYNKQDLLNPYFLCY
jgi:3'(2'), 5'-bisphosphate nucleotidase